MKKQFLLLLVALFYVFFSIFYLQSSKAQSSDGPAELFEFVIAESGDEAISVQAPLSMAEVRKQEISIKFDNINFELAQQLSFPALDGRSYTAIRRSSEGFVRLAGDEFSWRGKINADDGWSGDVILTVKGRALSGLLYTRDAVYEIIPRENYRHALVEIDQGRFLPCGGSIRPPEDEPKTTERIQTFNKGVLLNRDKFNLRAAADGVTTDDGSTIDVLVVYTKQVVTTMGGSTQTENYIQQMISSTNTAYQNSQINPRLRLAATLESDYDEAAETLNEALRWVSQDPTVATARTSANADLVAIIVDKATDACGIAFTPNSITPEFEKAAFSATALPCTVGGLTFAHEIGHNQGCEHNPEQGRPPAAASYPYAFGHYVDGSFRTVMSYPDPCPSGCRRIPYFSNPDITFNGQPTGIANQRDNHRVINNSAQIVSKFRYPAPNLTMFQPPEWSNPVLLSAATGATGISLWMSTEQTLYLSWDVINDGSIPTSGNVITTLYLDEVEKQSWTTSAPLNPQSHYLVRDYPIGKLSQGIHQIRIVTDSTSAISERSEKDNEYIMTFNVSSPPVPNLTQYSPPGWDGPIVISNTTGTNRDVTSLSTSDTLYVDWAINNNGTAATAADFTTKLYVDGVEKQSWTTPPPFNLGSNTSIQDYSIGKLSAGTHTIRIVTDANETIAEKYEDDNQFEKVITVSSAPAGIIHLSMISYNFSEATVNTPQGFGALSVVVTRTDSSGQATVQYQTLDQYDRDECNLAIGWASQRCDYAAQAGTLRFSAGESTKTIQIPIVNDGYTEGNEIFFIRLQNPTGASLDTRREAIITIEDSGVVSGSSDNPYLKSEFFVRMNYLDFLFREPDSEGWATWPGVLNNCGPEKGFLGSPRDCDRAHVAHGFIASREFTEKGYLIYRMYEAALSRLPRYAEFIPNMASMSGAVDSQELLQNTQQFVESFTSRQEFTDKYQDVSQPAQASLFIARLEQNAGVTLPAANTTLPGQPTQYGRQELINLRANGTFTLGQTLRAFVEQKVVYDRFFERGFVTMQYFGFLRRDPDLNDPNLLGWTEWVFVFTNGGAQRGRPDILPRDYHHLTFGFIYSEEYRKRFGKP